MCHRRHMTTMTNTTTDSPIFLEEHELLRKTIRQFATARVEPQAMEHDESQTFNAALLRELAGLGLMGITVPEADGGAGMDATAACIVHEELAYADPGFALGYLAHTLLFVNNFYWGSNPAQRKRYLPDTLTGKTIGAMAMTEPKLSTPVLLTVCTVSSGSTLSLARSKTNATPGLTSSVSA